MHIRTLSDPAHDCVPSQSASYSRTSRARFLCSQTVKNLALSVILLTPMAIFSGCALISNHIGEMCKTRAYIRTDIEGLISSRFERNSPVRMAVVPFSVPANLAGKDNQFPGLGNQLAWSVQRELMSYETLPIIEVFNRVDWPGKKEEFFTGNFGALQFAKDAGYDLLLIGFMEPATRIDVWTVHTKIIEVDSGISVWFGTSKISTNRADLWEPGAVIGLYDRRPDLIYSHEMVDEAARCIAHDILHDPAVE